MVWVIQDLSSLETPFGSTSPIHLPCPMSATTLQATAGQPFIKSCLDGMNSLSLVPLGLWYFLMCFSLWESEMNINVQLAQLLACGSKLLCTSKGFSFQSSLDVEIIPVHIIWTFMLEDTCFSPPIEENSVACAGSIISEVRALFPCLARGFVLWGKQLCLPMCSPLPWGHTLWVFPEVFKTSLQSGNDPWCHSPVAYAHLELHATKEVLNLPELDYLNAMETLLYVLLSADIK